MDEIEQKYPSITIISQDNIGLINSIRKILDYSRADYFIRVDADDWVSTSLVENLYSAFAGDPEIGLTYPDYYETNKQGRILRRVQRHDISKDVTLLDMPAHARADGPTNCIRVKSQIV